jgi:hypothetical protein
VTISEIPTAASPFHSLAAWRGGCYASGRREEGEMAGAAKMASSLAAVIGGGSVAAAKNVGSVAARGAA